MNAMNVELEVTYILIHNKLHHIRAAYVQFHDHQYAIDNANGRRIGGTPYTYGTGRAWGAGVIPLYLDWDRGLIRNVEVAR